MRTLICEYESSIKHTQDMVFRNIKKKKHKKKTLIGFVNIHSLYLYTYLLPMTPFAVRAVTRDLHVNVIHWLVSGVVKICDVLHIRQNRKLLTKYL